MQQLMMKTPFIQIEAILKSSFKIGKLKSFIYPKELNTIGDCLRVWRIDNILLQNDIAKIPGVCEGCIVRWEI